jgi:hypothetical protein
MSRQGNKYEPTVAFILIVFKEKEGKLIKTEEIYLQEECILPISQKVYKTTLKNIEVYTKEYFQANPEVKSIRLDRISHIKILERSKDKK